MNIHFEKLNPMKNQFLTTLIRIVSIGLFSLIVVFPGRGFAQVEEPEIEENPPINHSVAIAIGKYFKSLYLGQICSIKPKDTKEIQDQKKEMHYKLDYNPEIVMLDLKISLVSRLFEQDVFGYCLIERPKRNRFLNLKTKDTIEVNFFEDENPIINKYLAEYRISPSQIGPLEAHLQFISGNMYLCPSFTLFKNQVKPESKKSKLLRDESESRLILKSRLYGYNASEPKWDSVSQYPCFTYFIAKCDITEGKSSEANVSNDFGNRSLPFQDVALVFYTAKPPQQVIQSTQLNGSQIYEVKILIQQQKSVTAIPQYRPLPPDELQQLIAKGKFYPYFHDN